MNQNILHLVVSVLIFLTIEFSLFGQNPYPFLGTQIKILEPDKVNHVMSSAGIIKDSTMAIANFNYSDRTITYKNSCGEVLYKDTLPLYIKAFTSVDPKASDTPWVSPYAYCLNNPVNISDPSGCSPIYSDKGVFLGTDDLGLQGEYYVMDPRNFKQGMSLNEVKKNAITPSKLSNSILKKIDDHYSLLPERPDYDGYLTLEEANTWFREGDGEPLFVDLSKIDLSGIFSLGDEYVGQIKTFNLLAGGSNNINDGLVYGNITLKRYPGNTVRAFADRYDFDMKSWKNPLNWARNFETILGKYVAGEGHGYEINIYGSAPLKPLFPWLK